KVDVPSDFYAKVSERHEKMTAKAKTKREVELPLEGLEKTMLLYYDDYLLLEFKAKVLKVLNNKYVVLDRTAFYPTSGGQLHDIGTIDGCKVTDIFKQGNIVVHLVSSPNFKEGNMIVGRIKRERRIQLAQHHTATHIINGVSRELLGEHIWQAGAEKTPEKARLDITHFETLSQERLNEIERKVNRIIAEGISVGSEILKRDRAEAEYGFRLYQGGAVPGRELRIVTIGDLDVEACGGTHLRNTSEAGVVKLIGSTKIQDGIVRLEYTAGKAAMEYIKDQIFGSSVKVLRNIIESHVLEEYAPPLKRHLKEIEEWLSSIRNEEDMRRSMNFVEVLDEELRRCAKLFSVQPEHLERTITRFLKEIQVCRREIKKIDKGKRTQEAIRIEGERSVLFSACETVFKLWKNEKKCLEQLKKGRIKRELEAEDIVKVGGYEIVVKDIKAETKDTLKAAKGLVGEKRIVVLFGLGERISVVGLRGKVEIHMGELVREVSKMLGGGGGGRPDFGQGAGKNVDSLDEAMEFARNSIIYKLKGR
ncbi:MAG: DHHA1 domain-containing protein, partial [Candidatus Hydrothermarchaeales archaeon]